jgi:ATP-dependent DNA ligase
MLKKPLPELVAPMHASSVKKPSDSWDWILETNLDAYRAIAVIDSTCKARIWSRNQLALKPKFPTVGDVVNQLKLRNDLYTIGH